MWIHGYMAPSVSYNTMQEITHKLTSMNKMFASTPPIMGGGKTGKRKLGHKRSRHKI